ncbi:MAG: AAA family ATPase [Candidatus Brocadiaceae bacterium]|nr:AAA family ATPase [Candidatus Brocadiaceae bacterium]
MFTTFFNMTEQPFSERVATEQIFRDERITQGIARLKFMSISTTLALIVGQNGVGKSVLIRLLISELPANQFLPVYIHFTNIKSSSLFKLIVTTLGEHPKLTKEQTFTQIIDKVNKSNLTVVLIIDESHLLDSTALTDLRLLISSALDDAPPLKIILSGQDGIKDKLKQSSHKDLADRISVRFHLKPMSKAQTQAYMDFHMHYAGSSDKIFDQDVKELIHQYSNGIPIQVNNISTACLINAAILKSQKITPDVLNQTMAEFQLF